MAVHAAAFATCGFHHPLKSPLRVTHEEKLRRWIGAGRIGVEIGAFNQPLPFIRPVYVDCFGAFCGEPVKADYYGHAGLLPFRDNSLDYVASSHVLEHAPDPVAALAEWYRVLRPGGIVYLVVPDRRFTWDHRRAPTPVEHMLEDCERGTTPCDETHIDEFVRGVDWAQFSPATPPAEVSARQAELAQSMHHAATHGIGVNIHFHVFEPSNLIATIERLRTWERTRFDWQVVDTAERFPTEAPIGILAVIRVRKGLRDAVEGAWHRWRTRFDEKHPLRKEAEPFAEFVRKSDGAGGGR